MSRFADRPEDPPTDPLAVALIRARRGISDAFEAINELPHGEYLPGKGPLADAQRHLAEARRRLDDWLNEDVNFWD